MGGNGGGPPFIKKEEESDSTCISICRIENNNNDNNHLHLHHVQKNEDTSNSRGISIAERRGFNASNMNAAHFNTTAPAPAPAPAFFTVPAGISPSALLDSPVMLPNVQAQLSPTTGTFQLLSPNHETLKLKLKLSCDGDGDGEDAVPMETCELVNGLSEPNNFMTEINNKPLEEEMRQNQMMLEVKTERSLQDHRNHHHQKSSSSGAMVNKNSDDGFYWRKYGQKHVKGSEYPRSYYKCTNSNCVVTKKVERSHDGHITEIVYKGSHNHPQPQPLKTTVDGASTSSAELRPDQPSPSFLNDSSFQPAPQEFAADEASPESAEDDDGEAKKRKRESLGSETAVPRSSREPKVVVQIESDIDILDDGYRWRKYGQKVVKGNPNPRSYYKCTTPGCPVRKHVERAADDIKSVITTYEGKHNHDVPSSKNGTVISADNVANLPPASKAAGKQQVQDLPLYLDRKTILNYKELMPPNLNLYPLPFPPFHSLPPPPPPTYGPLLMTTNPTYRASSSSSKLYPIMPDFMPPPPPPPPPMPSSHAAHHHYGPPISYAPHHQLHPSPTPVLPKEEQLRDEDQLYDTTCLSLPNQGNGTSM